MNVTRKLIGTPSTEAMRLKRCGVDTATADISVGVGFYNHDKLSLNPYSRVLHSTKRVPAWSLGALLNLLPDTLNDVDIRPAYGMNYICDSSGWILSTGVKETAAFGELDGKLQITCDNGLWVVNYSNKGFPGTPPSRTNLLEAVVDAIILLKYNKVPLNGEPDDEPEEPSSEQPAEEDDDLPF